MRASDASAGCLLRVGPDGFRLEADLSVAVRGLPEAPGDLRTRVEASGGRARVLTRLGSYGAPSPLVAVALTTLAGSAARRGVLVVLTASGNFLLRTEEGGSLRPLTSEELTATLAALGPSEAVFVTADAGVSLRDVTSWLRSLSPALAGRVALATVLPEDARAPEETSPDDGDPLCDGLPELAADAPIGTLEAAPVRDALALLVPAAQACVATSASGLGGLVRLAFRVETDGHVQHACVVEDATDDPTLRRCLALALRSTVFPRPTGGAVDFELPLRLEIERDPAHAQRPICE